MANDLGEPFPFEMDEMENDYEPVRFNNHNDPLSMRKHHYIYNPEDTNPRELWHAGHYLVGNELAVVMPFEAKPPPNTARLGIIRITEYHRPRVPGSPQRVGDVYKRVQFGFLSGREEVIDDVYEAWYGQYQRPAYLRPKFLLMGREPLERVATPPDGPELMTGEPSRLHELDRQINDQVVGIYLWPGKGFTIQRADPIIEGKQFERYHTFSAYSAVEIMHDVLLAKRALVPVDEFPDQGSRYINFAQIETYYPEHENGNQIQESAKYYYIEAAGPRYDCSIEATYRKDPGQDWRIVDGAEIEGRTRRRNVRRYRMCRSPLMNQFGEFDIYLEETTGGVSLTWHVRAEDVERMGRMDNKKYRAIMLGRTFGTDGGIWKFAEDLKTNQSLYLSVLDGIIRARVEVHEYDNEGDRGITAGYFLGPSGTEYYRRVNNLNADNNAIQGWLGYSGGRERGAAQNYVSYHEYAPFSDLHGLIETFKDRNVWVPEVFLWILFRNLVQACQGIEAAGYVHPQLRPANILLKDRPAEHCYPAYYEPVVSNFESVWFLFPEEAHRNTERLGMEGWEAPETEIARINGQGTYRISDRLHTYAIGHLIWCIMSNTHRTGRSARLDIWTGRQPHAMYSFNLTSLVRQCMNQNPMNRPNLDDLQRRVDAAIVLVGHTLGKNLRDMTHDDLLEAWKLDHVNSYPVGEEYRPQP